MKDLSAEGRTLEERLADLELRIGAINRLWQGYGNRFDALEARLAGDGRSVLSTLPIYADWKRDAQYVAEVLDWLLAQMRTLRGEASVMARYSTGRHIVTCRQCADFQWRSGVYKCGRRNVRIRLDQSIPRRCPLPVAPKRDIQP